MNWLSRRLADIGDQPFGLEDINRPVEPHLVFGTISGVAATDLNSPTEVVFSDAKVWT